MAVHVEPFSFDRVFVPPAEGKAGDAPVPTDASHADLLLEIAALRAEAASLRAEHEAEIAIARAQGFDAGLEQARAEQDVALLSAVDALQASVEALDERFGTLAAQARRDAAETALAAAELLAGHAIDMAPTRAIEEALDRALAQVARGTEIEARVHPELVAPMEEAIARRQSRDRRRLALSVVGDATMAPGDALIAWEAGGSRLNRADRRAAVEAELAPLFLHGAATGGTGGTADRADAGPAGSATDVPLNLSGDLSADLPGTPAVSARRTPPTRH